MKLIVRLDTTAAPDGSAARRSLLAALKKAGFTPTATARPHLAALGYLSGSAASPAAIQSIPGVLSISPDEEKRKV